MAPRVLTFDLQGRKVKSEDAVPFGLGQLASATKYVNDRQYTSRVDIYSETYQPVKASVVLPEVESGLAGTYTSRVSYRPDGSVYTEDLAAVPAAGLVVESVLHTYDDLGQALTTNGGLTGSTTVFASATSFTKYGEVQRIQLGASGKRAWLSSYYDVHTRRLDRQIVDAEVSAPMQADVSYSYDDAGNVKSVVDAPREQPADVQCFEYDYLRRLSEAWTPSVSAGCGAARSVGGLSGPAPYWQSFGYDKSGNRTSEVAHTGAGDTTRTYDYPVPGSAQAHTVKSVTTAGVGGPKSESFGYDAAGNTTARPGQVLEWDVEGRLVKVTEGSKVSTFVYGPDGSRLLRKDPDATTLYLPGQEVRLATGASAPTVTRYYSHAGRTIAMREGKTKLTWLAADHQGTSQIAIDVSSMTTTRRRQLPFGGARGPVLPVGFPGEKGFVGGTNDVSTGLVHIGARQYDAGLGKFLSVDPVMDIGNPQQWNGYAYADNSPITNSDPTGLIAKSCPDGDCSIRPPDAYVSQPMGGGDVATGGNRAAPEGSARDNWTSGNSPKTNDANRLISIFSSHTTSYSYGSEYWSNGMGGDEQACYGRTGCQMAWIYLSENPDDVKGAKDIAANYCVDNFAECSNGATSEELASQFLAMAGGGAIGAAAAASRIRAGAASRGAPSRGSCGGPNSFTGDTLVLMADGSSKPIKEVKVGDKIANSEPEIATTEQHEVTAVHVTDADKEYVDLAIATPDGSKTITTTAHHPFYNASAYAWADAVGLKAGEELSTPGDGRATILVTRNYTANLRTYNLTVADIHTYYVLAGNTPIVVHNAGDEPSPNVIQRGVQQIQDGTLQQRISNGRPDVYQGGNNSKSARWTGAKIYQPIPGDNRYRILEKDGKFAYIGPDGKNPRGHNYNKVLEFNPKC